MAGEARSFSLCRPWRRRASRWLIIYISRWYLPKSPNFGFGISLDLLLFLDDGDSGLHCTPHHSPSHFSLKMILRRAVSCRSLMPVCAMGLPFADSKDLSFANSRNEHPSVCLVRIDQSLSAILRLAGSGSPHPKRCRQQIKSRRPRRRSSSVNRRW